jgi:hypothetical protein
MTVTKSSKAGFAGELDYFVKKELTFSNDTGTVSLFTVTGDLLVKIVPVCKTNVASAAAGNIEMGVSGDTNAMIAATTGTDIDANEIWVDASPDSNIEPMSTVREYIISNSDNVILTLSAQIDSGAITFYCYWSPLSDGATLTAA